jgi:UDP-glucose 4-epimerase
MNFDIHHEAVAGQKNYRPLDIRSMADLRKLNPDLDYIFLFAGHTGTSDGFGKYEEFISVNELGLLNLLAWMRESNCKAKIIFPSTRLVYKGNEKLLSEEDDKQPKTIYAANKLAAEQLLWLYYNAFSIDYTVFRICVPYGNLFDDKFSYGTIGFFLKKAISGNNITLYGNGKIMRTFTHVEDICMIIIGAIMRNDTGANIYNIPGENLSLFDVARLIAQKYKVLIEFKDWPEMDWKLETGDTMFDASKLNKLIHYNLKFNVQDWVSSF